MHKALPLAAALLLVLALLGRPAHALQGTIGVCEDRNEWPPYSYEERLGAGRRGELTGYAVELLRLIARRQGWELRFSLLPWKRCLEAVKSGEELMLLNAIRTPERERDYLLSAPIYETRLLALWSRRQHPQGLGVGQQSDLARLRIGGLHGYSYSQLEQIDLGRMVRAPNYESLFQMLHLGRLDVALINEGVMRGLAALGHPALRDRSALGVAVLEDRQPSRFHMLFTRARPEGALLRERVDAELRALEGGPEIAHLRARFLRPLQ